MAALLRSVVYSGGGRDGKVRPSPRGKLRRLSAGDSVGQRNCVARIRTEVGVGLEIGEHLRDFLGAWEPTGKKFLRDLLERELVSLSIQRGDDLVEAQEVADQRQMFAVPHEFRLRECPTTIWPSSVMSPM